MERVHTVLSSLRSWRPWWRRAPEPGAALFRGLRLRLTLLYTGVLAVALLAGGMVVYFGLQDLILSPVGASARSLAELNARDWQRNALYPCQPGGRPELGVRRGPDGRFGGDG